MRQHLTGSRGSSVLHQQVGDELDHELGRHATAAEIAAWLNRCEIRWREADDPERLKETLLSRVTPRLNRMLPGQRRPPGPTVGRFDRLAAGPYFDAVVAANRAYLDAAVPDAEATERDHWALSCLPSTRTNPPRLSAVSMKTMETFVVHEPFDPAADPTPAGFVVVRGSLLGRHWSARAFRKEFPRLEREPSGYADGSADQERVAGPVDALITALADERFAAAARALAASLLPARTMHSRGHNSRFADQVLGRTGRTSDWIYPVNERSPLWGEERTIWEYFAAPEEVVDWRLGSSYHQIAAGDRIWAYATEPVGRLVAVGVVWDDPYQQAHDDTLGWRVAIRWDADLTRYLLSDEHAVVGVPAGSVRSVRGLLPQESELLMEALDRHRAPEPESLPEGRRRRLAEVTARQGQSEFRRKLMVAYGGRCAITGCDTEAALQAAHISPYDGPATNRVTNGLLLRADLHNLFDRGLIWVDGEQRVRVKSHVVHYAPWHGEPLRPPARDVDRPDPDALALHRRNVAGIG
ncbi:HNH endonuclease [Micromonospora coxensis]|uniref:HNH endonuclease n=1 Tax=Micromonospora coxensis TaxID=356852 RepID=UPI00342D9DAD